MATRFVRLAPAAPEPSDPVVVMVTALPSGTFEVSYHGQSSPEAATFVTEQRKYQSLQDAKDRAAILAEQHGGHTVYLRGVADA